jgi:hypothetical protein
VVYTPKPLVTAMIQAVGHFDGATWLEPSCGTGAFLQALAQSGVPTANIVGVDVQSRPARADKFATVLRGTDFLQWSQRAGRQFDRVVGNPPYVRIGELPGSLRARAASVPDLEGKAVGLRSNCWLAFLCACVRLVKDGGNLALVLPAAFDYANYARHTRKLLPTLFKSVDLHRSNEPLFDAIKDGVIVLIARGRGQSGGKLVRREYPSAAQLIHGLLSRASSVCNTNQSVVAEPNCVRLRTVLDIRIGAVCGNADYFLLSDSRRRKHRIPAKACVPIVSRTRHLSAAVIGNEQWASLKARDQRVWLFRPSRRQAKYPAVAYYLRTLREPERGFKVRTRTPWYQTIMPDTPDVFLSGQWSSGPWLALRSKNRLAASNTLYVGRFHDRHLSLEEKAAWGLSLLTTSSFECWKRQSRRYADGLIKCEPSDLGNIEIAVPTSSRGALITYIKAVDVLLDGHATHARHIADEWMRQSCSLGRRDRQSRPFEAQ